MKIYKYKLRYSPVPQQYVSIELPVGATILGLLEDHVYARVDTEAALEQVYFYLYWTGVECQDGSYLGSFIDKGNLIYHVFRS